ncbi:MAG TPA: sigma-70 family RNA polymerase sigma factor [Burkholderiaceae bacterium]
MTDLQPSELKALLAAVAQRDAVAFRRLYDATSPKLFGFAVRILKKGEWAEEVLQECYVSIWNSAAQYQPALAAPMTWMATIVRNKAFDALRKVDHAAELDADTLAPEVMHAMESTELGPLASLQLSDDARSLAHCMTTLDSTHRQAVALAFFHDLSHSEVAEQMKLPLGTVKTWIRRSLDRLRTCLAKLERV